jgi:hypothetical protein
MASTICEALVLQMYLSQFCWMLDRTSLLCMPSSSVTAVVSLGIGDTLKLLDNFILQLLFTTFLKPVQYNEH